MKYVTLPFLARFEKPMIEGTKTLTSRREQYGEVGDRFVAFGHDFEITSVGRMLLSQVADLWRQEGVESRGEFMRIWSSLHRGIWNPNVSVYVHGFKMLWKHCYEEDETGRMRAKR